MIKSRIENSKRNIIFGIIGKICQLLLKFALKTAIIYMFGIVYLGLDGLFLNVISVLSIAELGISNAVCFALYKPFAKSEFSKIASYIYWFKRVYIVLGGIVLCLGCICIPLLKYIVNFDNEVDVNYYMIYLLFLLNSVVSYWFGAYYQVLYIADQQEYVVNNVKNSVYVVTVILQIFLIYLFRNYYIYLFVMILGTGITNMIVACFAQKDYSAVLEEKDRGVLEKNELNSLKKNIFALAVSKFSTVINTSSDNIVISVMIGTIAVGRYSNYSYIISAVSAVIAIIFNGLLASVGNANALEASDKMQTLFYRISFLNSCIYGICYICFMQLFQNFVQLWAGNEYLLDKNTVCVIGLLFLIPGLHHTCMIFKDACGLFWETRYRMLATAFINILMSIILAPVFGLSGIFMATIIAYLLTTFIYDPCLITKKVFGSSAKGFYNYYIKSLLTAVLANFLISFPLGILQVNGWSQFIGKAFLTVIMSSIIYLAVSYRSSEFLYYKNLLKKL